MIDGRPIVLFYAAAFAKKWDQGFVDYTRREFAKEFGGRTPWIAPQDSWHVKGDGVCAWGGALGYRNPGIGEIGPSAITPPCRAGRRWCNRATTANFMRPAGSSFCGDRPTSS